MIARMVTVWALVLVWGGLGLSSAAEAQNERRLPQSVGEIHLSFAPLVR